MILKGMTDFVCGDRNRRQGAPGKLVRCQAYCFRQRIVVVPVLRLFDRDVFHAVRIEQKPREVGAAAWIAILGCGIASQHATNPKPRSEYERQQ